MQTAEIETAFRNRLNIYRTKRDQASSGSCEPIYDREDALRYVIEALCHTARDCGLKIPMPELED